SERPGVYREMPWLAESICHRDLPPRLERERIRHPAVAVVRVVFDEEQRRAGLQEPTNARQDRRLVLHEVQRVRHDDAVERRLLEMNGEVGHVRAKDRRLAT